MLLEETMIEVMMESELFKIPLTLSARIRAEEFSRQQSNSRKAKQVYQNTLTVAAVNTYLQCLGWVTSLENSDSWYPLMQTLLDIADLELPGYGKLECRLIQAEERVMVIPEEVSSDRIAYIAVNIEQSRNLAYLLGFATEVSSSTIPLSRLKPITELPEYLEQYEQNSAPQKQLLPKLSDWLSGVVEAGWNTLDSLRETQPDMVFRIPPSKVHFCTGIIPVTSASEEESRETLTAGVSRVKLWDLGQRDNYRKIALVITLLVTENEEIEISIKVCPTNENAYLPEGLVIKILDEAQQPILQAQTKTTNENIEFFLSGEAGEFFSIQAALNGVIKRESFMI